MALKRDLTQNKIQTIQKSIITHQEQGRYVKSHFNHVYHSLEHSRHTSNEIVKPLSFIAHDFHNVLILTGRLEWMREQAEIDPRLETFWRYSSALDIEYFHVEVRSIMDYVAFIIRKISDAPGKVVCKSVDKYACSFEKLFNWMEKDERNRHKLGADMASLILSAEWFKDIREVRDAIIHGGGESIVYLKPKDGIFFQLSKRYSHDAKGRVSVVKFKEALMYSDEIIRFDCMLPFTS